MFGYSWPFPAFSHANKSSYDKGFNFRFRSSKMRQKEDFYIVSSTLIWVLTRKTPRIKQRRPESEIRRSLNWYEMLSSYLSERGCHETDERQEIVCHRMNYALQIRNFNGNLKMPVLSGVWCKVVSQKVGSLCLRGVRLPTRTTSWRLSTQLEAKQRQVSSPARQRKRLSTGGQIVKWLFECLKMVKSKAVRNPKSLDWEQSLEQLTHCGGQRRTDCWKIKSLCLCGSRLLSRRWKPAQTLNLILRRWLSRSVRGSTDPFFLFETITCDSLVLWTSRLTDTPLFPVNIFLFKRNLVFVLQISELLAYEVEDLTHIRQ